MSLSRLALILVAGIILLAIIGIWMEGGLLGVWRWPAAVLVVLLVLERLGLQQDLAIGRQLQKTVALGEVAAYTLTVNNPGRSVLRLETQADYPDCIEGDNALQHWQLRPQQSQSREYQFVPIHLGEAALGKLYLRQLGRFGLCWWGQSVDDGAKAQVVPVRLTHKPAAPGQFYAESHHNRQRQGSGVELLELSDYQPGDPLRSIDWKATAKRGKAITRHFEREHRLDMAILIDCGNSSRIQCGRLGRLQHCVNVAAKLAEFAALQNDRIAVLAYAQQPMAKTPLAGGIGAVAQIRHLLGGLATANEAANALNAALAVKQLLKRRGLVVFLTEIEQPGAALQLLQAAKLLASKHQVLVASLEDPAIATLLKQPMRQWQDPYRHFAALEYQRGRELTRSQLQRAGVAIISATAERLDFQILAYYQEKRDKISGA